MMSVVGFVVGVLFAAAFPGPSAVIRSMVAYVWKAAVEKFESLHAPKE